MATIRANASGEIIQFLQTPQQEAQFGTPAPPETVYELRFDHETNSGILAAYNANSAEFALPGGTLTQSGTPATINPPGAYFEAQAALPDLLVKLDPENPDALTTAELKQALTLAFRAAGITAAP